MWACGGAMRSVSFSIALAIAFMAGGCASQTAKGDASAVTEPTGASQLAYAGQRVPVEDDGLPVQLAPRDRPSHPDDPNEPWSPNYGSKTPIEASASIGPSPAGQLISFFTGPKRMARSQEDAIIRQAIAEHEMRRQ